MRPEHLRRPRVVPPGLTRCEEPVLPVPPREGEGRGPAGKPDSHPEPGGLICTPASLSYSVRASLITSPLRLLSSHPSSAIPDNGAHAISRPSFTRLRAAISRQKLEFASSPIWQRARGVSLNEQTSSRRGGEHS
ncbi:uncharacterized protein LOC119004469 isoform X6 [Acanthopagrus latus]|uniref:uncharacterized protein LOC119004469 isoform X6 n=1 Tax=Acanthopagrus latus TaxID=8177 RepID=UPI00187CCA03|nr:uncharacterized protein LOC119004469 isoform X6 [Acanthopagrus latus]